MDPHMMDDLGTLIKVLFILVCVSVPLGIWKVIELIGWAANHVSVH